MNINKVKISRRDFLRRTSVAAVAASGFPCVIPSSALGRGGSVAPSNRITMGCIGVGNMGVKDMKAFLHKDEVQILAVCDVNKASYGYKTSKQYMGREPARELVNDYYKSKNSAGEYRGCDSYADFREVLGRADIDAVCIVTPDHWHGVMTIKAARAGKDIYCEKPLSLTIAEGRSMVEAVRQYGVVLQTGTHHRSSRQVRFVCELVRNGRIGELKRMYTILSRHPVRTMIKNWRPMPANCEPWPVNKKATLGACDGAPPPWTRPGGCSPAPKAASNFPASGSWAASVTRAIRWASPACTIFAAKQRSAAAMSGCPAE